MTRAQSHFSLCVRRVGSQLQLRRQLAYPQLGQSTRTRENDATGRNAKARTHDHAKHTVLSRETETGWEVFEQGLTDTLTWVKNHYGDIPMYITENGAAFFDSPDAEPLWREWAAFRDPTAHTEFAAAIG